MAAAASDAAAAVSAPMPPGQLAVRRQMCLAHFTLQRPTAITHAVFGNFSAPKVHEVAVARGRVLELLRPDDNAGTMKCVLSTDVFGVIRSLAPFRLFGMNTDWLVVGSDSGRLVVLQYNGEHNRFDKLHEETYGKSGCRRVVPGQYLAVDPRGRALMIGAIEKQKLVYILNRDSHNKLIISSPLEAHKSHTIVFDMCGVDVDLDNPIFACLEVNYETSEERGEMKDEGDELTKMLVFYELDLGANHVTRKWSERTIDSANALIAVPGGADGPGGVLIAAADSLIYRSTDGAVKAVARLPQRVVEPGAAATPSMIVAHAAFRRKAQSFFLLQNERGDLFRVTLVLEEQRVKDLQIRYFDTVPTAAALCVMRAGFLFTASEFGNHYLFLISGVGDDEPLLSSSLMAPSDAPRFVPRALKNLQQVDMLSSLAPITDLKVADLTKEGVPQIYVACGRGPRSSLRVLRHGLSVAEVADSQLPGVPLGIWAVKSRESSAHHSFIVVSFPSVTIVLSVGDTVQELQNSGFVTNKATLCVANMGPASIVQVHDEGVRLLNDQAVSVADWNRGRRVSRAACNGRQLAVVLEPREVVVAELDAAGRLQETATHTLPEEASFVALSPVLPGRQRGSFVAVGDFNSSVRIFSLEGAELFKLVASVVLSAPRSGCFYLTPGERSRLFLYVGCDRGVLARVAVDEVTGAASDRREKVLGAKPVRLHQVHVGGERAVLALAGRPWLVYWHQKKTAVSPLSYEEMDHAAGFSSDACPEGIVCTARDSLRIVTVENLGETFSQTVFPLSYTPRKFVFHPLSNHLIIIETEARSFSHDQAIAMISGEGADAQAAAKRARRGDEAGGDASPEEALAFRGAPQAPAGRWASCVRVLDPMTGQTLHVHELSENEAAFSIAVVDFREKGDGKVDELFVAVGTAKDYELEPRKFSEANIHLFRLLGPQLQFIHKTRTEEVPLALAPFQQRLLAGVGKVLRLYDFGRKKLLRKSENRSFSTLIQSISTRGNRIYVGDMCDSLVYAKFKRVERQLHVFADSITPRYLTAQLPVDNETVCAADKFGNLFFTRLPADTNEDALSNLVVANSRVGASATGSAPNKLDEVVQFHVGDMVTALAKGPLGGGTDLVVYGTIMGAIGVLMPLASHDEVELFSQLEMQMRHNARPLCGRDHLAFRSYYFPVKDVVDFDLVEQFGALPHAAQVSIAEALGPRPHEIIKGIEDLRSRAL
jgi:splicing factor 3B subunit 3